MLILPRDIWAVLVCFGMFPAQNKKSLGCEGVFAKISQSLKG